MVGKHSCRSDGYDNTGRAEEQEEDQQGEGDQQEQGHQEEASNRRGNDTWRHYGVNHIGGMVEEDTEG
eukprot:15578690-Heterocapsa_arctica.AAC.1